ncbi:MAG TPA: PA14 domain-containing protein [Verrucomicrobiae bacterium]|nr:PA14 domain-containing protein [Verrucomicrobiae bacterium]
MDNSRDLQRDTPPPRPAPDREADALVSAAKNRDYQMTRVFKLSIVITPLLLGASMPTHPAQASDRVTIDLSGPGWSLWQDKHASWSNDVLFAPPVDLAQVPRNPPTGGWDQFSASNVLPVSVPGTVAEYLARNLDPNETDGMKLYSKFEGVSWWFRTVHVPKSAAGRRLLLHFDSVKLRAEVYVNRQLVAYDMVGDTPFTADITTAAKPGQDCQLAVRVTNPGGNMDWEDYRQFKWGDYNVPYGHAFGGITGRVTLEAVEPVYIDNIYVQNTPAPRAIRVLATIQNATAAPTKRNVSVHIAEKQNHLEVFRRELPAVLLVPGTNTVTMDVSVPVAKLWDLDHPNLYDCTVQLADKSGVGDASIQPFGFRWFAPEGQGTNALFRLNGKRIVLRTAISWGFWPINGISPSPDLAERQIRDAKTFGMNMLNFHRCNGNPIVMNKADELGLLYFEEPGGYVAGGKEAFGQALARERLLRTVRRDRSHPSVIIFNMINEQWDSFGANTNDALQANFRNDIQAAHQIDPSRTIVFASSWARSSEAPSFVKMHMRPFDGALHYEGWYDFHRAGGPETWRESFYTGPDNHYMRTTNAHEIVYWGEEGAVSSPPQLGRIKSELSHLPRPGWDGEIYLAWFDRFDQFLTRKDLRNSFPTVDALCTAMGNVAIEHQGRKIEDLQICDLNDGYAINGWEAMPFENHSGIVDEFRNPKGDPTILAHYNQPLYIAVKVRRQIYQLPDTAIVDFYAIDEKNLRGPFILQISATNPSGKEVFSDRKKVSLVGGDVYGQLLAEAIRVPVGGPPGMLKISASLVDDNGKQRASGRDEILAVDWKSATITGNGAVYEGDHDVGDFLNQQLRIAAPAFDGTQTNLDWLVVARPPHAFLKSVEGNDFVDADGHRGGFTRTIFRGDSFQEPLARGADKGVHLEVDGGATPDPSVAATEDYGVRWEGQLVPPAGGQYMFRLERARRDDRSRLFVDDRCVINTWEGTQTQASATIELPAGKPVPIRVEFYNHHGSARLNLMWQSPNQLSLDPSAVVNRAAKDGTTIIIADYADEWMNALKPLAQIKYNGRFSIGMNWLGGQYFVKNHPLFKGLPVDCALNWPYQAVVRNGRARYALMMDGEEFVAGGYETMGCKLGTAVGIVNCGRGKVIVSTLDICPQLSKPPGAADVARKLMVNYLEYASAQTR